MKGSSGNGPPEGPDALRDLRRRAEERMTSSGADLKRMDAEEIRSLVAELQVHQIELEIQNEELRRVQIELAQTRDRYFELYELAPVGYLTLDHRSVIRECNLAASGILGMERSRLQGRPFGSLVSPEDGDACHLHFQEALASETSVTTELRLRRPDAPIWVRLETRAARKSETEPSGYRVTFSDVTARRNAEDQLRALTDTLERRVADRTAEAQARAADLQRLARQLSNTEESERRRIAGLVHDGLQQDLVALRYKVDSLALGTCRGTRDEETIHELDAAIDESVARARELSYDLSPPLLHENGLLPALEWLSREAGRRYGLSVAVTAGPLVEPVSPAIAAVLFRSVKELLLNIRKHSGAPSAEITVSRTADQIRVRVEDAGRGFDEATLKTRDASAAGFGLHSVEERLRFLGGKIAIESGPGRGCRVILEVPADVSPEVPGATRSPGVEPAGPASATPPGARPAPGPAQPPVIRVLLADDHALMRQGLATLLAQEKGLEIVAQVADGLEAVRLASELRPDVVLMDISMPRMDGFEATRRIKQLHPEIRIIGLSMHDDPIMAEKMRASGAEAYLCKTGSPARLVEEVRAARH